MPTIPKTPWRARVAAPTAKVISAPSPHRSSTPPGSAPSTGPMITAPPSPPTIATSAIAISRIAARRGLDGRAPVLIARIEAHR